MNNNITTIEVEKKKKGRPKKTVIEVENINDNNIKEVEKKKRGRKKKKVEEVKIKKKRGRKAALKYFSSSIRKQISLKTNIVDNENNILFLDIQDHCINNESETPFINLKDINDNIISNTSDIDFQLNNLSLYSKDTDTLPLTSSLTDTTTATATSTTTMEVTDSFNDMNLKKDEKNNILEDDIELQKNNIKKGYFQMFNYFQDWVESTDVKCWWCCHNFDTLPLGYPVTFEPKINKFRVKGIFCSFGCMLAYAKNTKGIVYKQYLIKYLYKKLTGCKFHEILYKEAPSRYCLKEFGGHLTIENFRKLSNEYTFYKMIEYPMYESRDYIAEIDLVNIKQINDKIFKNEKNIILLDDKKIQEVKQRISKIDQTTTISNSIENFIKN